VLGLALFALMYGFSKIASPLGMVLTGFGVVCLVSFVTLESRITQPLVDIDLFRKNTVFAFSNLAALVNYAATFAVAFLLSLYLQEVRGLTPQQAGIIMVSQPVMQAVVSPLAGVVSDHIEPRTVSSIGMAITLVGLIMMIFVTPETATAYIIACLLTLGLGFGLFSSPNTNAIMSSIERRYYGVGGAMVGLMRQIGMMFSMGIVMMMMDLMIGGSQISVESQDSFMSAMRISFTVFAAMCFGGIFASLARGKLRESQAGDVGDVTVAH
jgi:MFS family permease